MLVTEVYAAVIEFLQLFQMFFREVPVPPPPPASLEVFF